MVNSPLAADEPILTIFTPAFNRADLLPRLFESIQSQVPEGAAVEWLVIDDGSSDETPSVLASFESTRPDLARSVRVENGGKHRAINRAASLARGSWVMIVDSDDLLAEGAVSAVLAHVDRIQHRREIGLLRGLKGFPGTTLNFRFEQPEQSATHASWIAAQPTFDSAEVIRTDALLSHPFPDFEGERFMAEGWLWHNLDKTHLTLFFNEAWVTCYYQEGGLSASSRKIRAKSPRGAMAVYEAMLDSPLPFRLRMRASANWWRYWFHAKGLESKTLRPNLLGQLAAPVGWWLYRQDCKLLS